MGQARTVLVDVTDRVPFSDGRVAALEDRPGRPALSIALDPADAPALEAFTRAHLGESIAIVVDGEAVSVHGVREPVVGGRMKISRCADGGCQTLFTRLAARPHAAASR
jgi:preprotein translocase subunit SecD